MSEQYKPLVRSSEWTGISDGWKFGFRSTKDPHNGQLPFFMTWQEYYDDNGEVVHVRVLFNSRDVPRRIRMFIERVFRRTIMDNSRCSECKGVTFQYPSNPLRKSYCPQHCPGHEYAYDRGMREWCCEVCGNPAPLDYYDNWEPDYA